MQQQKNNKRQHDKGYGVTKRNFLHQLHTAEATFLVYKALRVKSVSPNMSLTAMVMVMPFPFKVAYYQKHRTHGRYLHARRVDLLEGGFQSSTLLNFGIFIFSHQQCLKILPFQHAFFRRKLMKID